MQQLTAAPRGQLTPDQVRHLLIGAAGVHYDRGLEVLDASLNVLADISDDFQGGTVTRSMNATVHGSCALLVRDGAYDVHYGTQLLRPYMTISDGELTARFNAGVYRVAEPSVDYTTDPATAAFTGSDRLALLDRPIGDAYTIGKGTPYLSAARQAIDAAGLDATTVRFDGTAAGAVLPADKSWPLLADTSAPGAAAAALPVDVSSDSTGGQTTWLRIVNELLAAINYRGLWADQDGVLRSGPYQPPSARTVEFDFNFDDAKVTVIDPGRARNVDQSAPVNKWIFQQSNLIDAAGNPIEPTEGAGQYTRTNQNFGPTSVNAQGGLVWPVVVQLDAADQATLVALGDAQVNAALTAAATLSVTTGPFPAAWHLDIYTYADERMNGETVIKVQGTEWTLDLGASTTPPANMTHTWQTVAGA